MSDQKSKPGRSRRSTRPSYSPNITESTQQNQRPDNARPTGNCGARPKLPTRRPTRGLQVSLDAVEESVVSLHRDREAAFEAVENGELEDVEQIEDMLRHFDLARQVLDEDIEEYELELKYLKREKQSLHKALSREREKQDKLREANRSDVPRGHPQTLAGPRLRS
ncbi:hypothetical protein HPB50_018018 [Hyalomma asiaticum]|uniref:Uncharacterized protein n=1 Tax=Hyalomma asiaticum TaxID=266040 RepID=A0ACB7SAM0_HYAAI|nr:hypothetical protein HPB50_018018 [Hyalomma asiaticum]